MQGIVTLNQGTNLIESIVDCLAPAATPCVAAGEDLIIRLTNGGNILCSDGRRRAQSSAIIDGTRGSKNLEHSNVSSCEQFRDNLV